MTVTTLYPHPALLPLTPPPATLDAHTVLTDAIAATLTDRTGPPPILVEVSAEVAYLELVEADAVYVLAAVAADGHLDRWSMQVEPWRRPDTTHRVVVVRVTPDA